MGNLKFKVCIILSILFIVFPFTAFSQTKADKIRIGHAISLSGPATIGAKSMNQVYDLWIEEVNAKGGIYVKEYDKRLPIELIRYDDKSDLGTMIKQMEKLVLDDKVNFLLPPFGTAFLYAAAPVANKHGYILMGSTGGAIKLKEIISGLPYFFSVLNFADTQMPVLVDLLAEFGVKKAAIIYIADLHGIEYSSVVVPELGLKGIDVVMVNSYPPGIKDLSPLLKKAMALNADAFLGFTYPAETVLVTRQAMEIGFNPKVFEVNVGSSGSTTFKNALGADVVEGVIGPGGWNAKISPGAKEFVDKFVKRWNEEPEYWGTLQWYSSLQFFQQAIEKAGTLNQKKIRDIMATEKFDTALGPFWFEKGFFANHPGAISQWQKGVFEIIGPKEKRTAVPIFPKPEWHKK